MLFLFNKKNNVFGEKSIRKIPKGLQSYCIVTLIV